LEAWLVLLLIRRRAQERFQLFVSYMAGAAVASLARLLLLHFVYVHFFTYWASELLLVLLSIAALNQIFWYTYHGFDFIWWFRPLYYGIILLALGLTVRAAIASPPLVSHPLISFIVDAELAANMVRTGIVALFSAMVRPMVVRFQRYSFGIILGFGFSSVGPCIAYIAFSIFGTRVKAFTDFMSAFSYIVALIVWLRVFSLPDTKLTKWDPPIPPEQMLGTVEGYMKAMGIRKRKRTK
jgi:hypothetical protein